MVLLSMDAKFNDIWTPDNQKNLPGRGALLLVAERCGQVWEMPDFAARVKIAYNPRLRTTLGQAFLDDGRVELNTNLLRAHPDHLIPTLVHELAHIAVYMRYGRVPPHGRHFRVLMAAVAMNAKATHDLPTAKLLRRRRGKFLYVHKCEDCGYSFVARKAMRNYYCIKCGPDMIWNIIRMPNNQQSKEILATITGENG